MSAHDAGHHGESKLPTVFGWIGAAVMILLLVNGVFNRLDGKDFFDGIFDASSRSPANFRGLTTSGRNPGYIAGAPRTALECIQRGGQVVNSGRSCSGYR